MKARTGSNLCLPTAVAILLTAAQQQLPFRGALQGQDTGIGPLPAFASSISAAARFKTND